MNNNNDNTKPTNPEEANDMFDQQEELDEREDEREECGEREEYEREDQFRDDVEADADALASAGYGTDEDYGCYGGDE